MVQIVKCCNLFWCMQTLENQLSGFFSTKIFISSYFTYRVRKWFEDWSRERSLSVLIPVIAFVIGFGIKHLLWTILSIIGKSSYNVEIILGEGLLGDDASLQRCEKGEGGVKNLGKSDYVICVCSLNQSLNSSILKLVLRKWIT